MARRIPEDHNYRTDCPQAVKARITALEHAAMEYAFAGSRPPEDREQMLRAAQFRRYNLERTILTCIDVAVEAAQEAEERHRREIEEGRQRADFAANEERNRQARIKAAEDEARAAREADQARRADVRKAIAQEILDTITPRTPSHSEPSHEEIATYVADAIMLGQIPHVKVEM